MKEMQKPLARYIDDEDLDRMLREQEREGDPMANFIKKNKAKENKNKKGETWGCWSWRWLRVVRGLPHTTVMPLCLEVWIKIIGTSMKNFLP